MGKKKQEERRAPLLLPHSPSPTSGGRGEAMKSNVIFFGTLILNADGREKTGRAHSPPQLPFPHEWGRGVGSPSCPSALSMRVPKKITLLFNIEKRLTRIPRAHMGEVVLEDGCERIFFLQVS